MFKKNKNNFIDCCLNGTALLEDIDDWIDEWHAGSSDLALHEFLGMSSDEYSSWVSMDQLLPFIITAHKENKNLKDILDEYKSSLPIAARADINKTNILIEWLKEQKLI